MNFETKPLSAGLYFVATPIGSARDMTLRGLDILASADVIAAEDTRTARKLMEIHGVPLAQRQLVAFHDHSGPAVIAKLLESIKQGRSVAYVSEAGTPLVADPGFELGLAAHDAGVAVTSAPGASAVIAALTVAGLPTDRFAFVGFLPASKVQRETEIASLRDTPFTLVFYESPKRVGEMLASLRDTLGEARQAAVCRELTKKFEEISRGEIVVLVGRAGAVTVSDGDIEMALKDAMKTMRIKDASTTVAGAFGLPRKQVYQLALTLKDDG